MKTSLFNLDYLSGCPTLEMNQGRALNTPALDTITEKGLMMQRQCLGCGGMFQLPISHKRQQYCNRSCFLKSPAFLNRRPRRPLPIEIRFWKRVNKDGPIPSHRPELGPCWLWTGALTRGRPGYGSIEISKPKPRQCILAHRFSWQLQFGPIPEGKLVCHHCDVPACVRPEHLFLGDYLANSQDAVSKGRIPRGSKNHNAIFTEEQVLEIKLLHRKGHSISEIQKQFPASNGAIYHIVNGLNWGWL